jgi:leader peptidase (prepilin peptidase)/N-methyltransferase
MELFTQPLLVQPSSLAFVFGVAAFVIGVCVGSFLNVLIARLPLEGASVVRPRSRCMGCHKPIANRDLIPIFSWIWLRGRCRHCSSRISPSYPLIELVMGCFGLSFVLKWGFSLHSLELFVFVGVLIAIAFIDAKTWLIPLSLPLFLWVTGLLFGLSDFNQAFMPRLIGSVGGFLFFAALLVVSTWALRRTGRLGEHENAMGWGDPFLLGALGAYLGYFMLPFAVLLACVQGLLAFGLMALLKAPNPEPTQIPGEEDWVPPQHAIPFGPFLALGGIEMALWQPSLPIIGQQFAIFLGL